MTEGYDELKQRFPDWLNERLDLLPKADPSLHAGAEHLAAALGAGSLPQLRWSGQLRTPKATLMRGQLC